MFPYFWKHPFGVIVSKGNFGYPWEGTLAVVPPILPYQPLHNPRAPNFSLWLFWSGSKHCQKLHDSKHGIILMFLWCWKMSEYKRWMAISWKVRTHVNLGWINTWGSSLFTWAHFCSLSVIYGLDTQGIRCIIRIWKYLCIFIAFLGCPLMKPKHGFVNPGQPSKDWRQNGWV